MFSVEVFSGQSPLGFQGSDSPKNFERFLDHLIFSPAVYEIGEGDSMAAFHLES